jgi:hypothetical protein
MNLVAILRGKLSATFWGPAGITSTQLFSSRGEIIKGETIMGKFTKWSIVPAAVLLLGTVAMAQDPTIHERKENQQDRIAQGVKSGQLTAHETANLERKEAAINRETRRDRAANGGKLTTAEKAKVTAQQNKVSNQIYRDKHNARTQK